MYKSPIEIMQSGINFQTEGEVMKAVVKLGVVVDKDELIKALAYDRGQYEKGYEDALTINIVRCKECRHRPIKEDADGENYGSNLIGPTEDDEICPCLVDDGWYSWMPEDNFFCGYGERKE